MEQNTTERVGRPAPRRRSIREKAGDALLVLTTSLGFLALVVGMPLWFFLQQVERDGLEETLMSMVHGASPLIAILVGGFIGGCFVNLSEYAAKRPHGSSVARALKFIAIVVGVATAILTLLLMFTYWSDGAPLLDEDCPWRGC